MSHFLTSFDQSHTARRPSPTAVTAQPQPEPLSDTLDSDIEDDDVIPSTPDDSQHGPPDSPASPNDSRPLFYLTELPAPPRPPSPTPPPGSPSTATSANSGSASSRANKASSPSSPTQGVGNKGVMSGKVVKGKSRKGRKEHEAGQSNTLLKYFASAKTAGKESGEEAARREKAEGAGDQGSSSASESG